MPRLQSRPARPCPPGACSVPRRLALPEDPLLCTPPAPCRHQIPAPPPRSALDRKVGSTPTGLRSLPSEPYQEPASIPTLQSDSPARCPCTFLPSPCRQSQHYQSSYYCPPRS